MTDESKTVDKTDEGEVCVPDPSTVSGKTKPPKRDGKKPPPPAGLSLFAQSRYHVGMHLSDEYAIL